MNEQENKTKNKYQYLIIVQDEKIKELIKDLMKTGEFATKSHIVRLAIIHLHKEKVINQEKEINKIDIDRISSNREDDIYKIDIDRIT